MRFRPNRLLLAAALAVLCVGVIAAPAAAQELPDPTGNETTTPPSTQTVEQLGDLTIHAYDYDSEREEMTIDLTWGGGVPETVTITEMTEMDSGGATEISFKQLRLTPNDRTEVTMSVAERSTGTAAVLITTPQSVEASSALVLQAGDATERGPVPFGWASILIGSAALGGAGLAFAFTARDQSDDADGQRRDRIA